MTREQVNTWASEHAFIPEIVSIGNHTNKTFWDYREYVNGDTYLYVCSDIENGTRHITIINGQVAMDYIK